MPTRRKYICPNCKQKTGADILYGFPDFKKGGRDIDDGYLIMGGCSILPDDPDRGCTACGFRWNIIRRKKV